ncbi:kinase-like domain-containing protein [Fimicolochytrium jonesii]|uniref:kinase-like domain-containing protein n=1 Tax=Fimicolochytrium jonesii TaxID=1396493 RepID=UPI0022FE141E|nr:kinase-like domain-containing protein [Fimicolochytrium jonesii]KAI8816809.1 kinase-like domain-containing protein [Fimicolochytrium jonesii]
MLSGEVTSVYNNMSEAAAAAESDTLLSTFQGLVNGTKLPSAAPAKSTAAVLKSIATFKYTIDHDKLTAGVSAVVEDVVLKQFTAGITNKLFRATHKPSGHAVLVRTYGKGSDILIDRNQELVNMQALSKLGLCPPLYGRFDNGLVYGFIAGTPFSGEDMSDAHKSILVAKRLAEWHGVALPGSTLEPQLFPTMFRWLVQVPKSYTNKAADAKFRANLSVDKLRQRLLDLQSALQALGSPVTFCHNDLLSGNIVYSEAKDTVSFIDYEYGSISYRGFDIGNHFCEYAGFDCKWELYPTKPAQLPWLRTYLESYTKRAVMDAEVENLYKEVTKFSLAAHFFWAIWALVQAEISDLDFDYLDYAITRLNYMESVWDEYLAL